jgi:hypothetical protein
MRFEFFDGLGDGRILMVAVEVDEEEIFPRFALRRAADDFAEADF